RAALEECDSLFQPLAGWSLMREFTVAEAESRMARADVAQPADLALQVGLAALWRSWGVVPSAIVGHSTGEVAAGHVAGGLSLPDALKVAYQRSRLQQQTVGEGKMLAVGLSPSEVEQYLTGHADQISLAAINSPCSITLSGDADILTGLEGRLKAQG